MANNDQKTWRVPLIFKQEEIQIMTIIEEIYNGNLFPISRLSDTDREYRKTMDDLIAAETALLKTYPEIKALFDKYQDAQIQLSALNNRREFVSGFRIGAQVALEMIKPIE